MKKMIGRDRRNFIELLILVAEILMILGTLFLGLQKAEPISIGPLDFTGNVTEEGRAEWMSPIGNLDRGVYKALLQYEAEEDETGIWEITCDNAPYKSLLGNACILYKGESQASMYVWVKAPLENCRVRVTSPQEQPIKVHGVSLEKSKYSGTVPAIGLLVLFLLLDGIYLWMRQKKKSGVTGVLCLIFFVASIPLLSGYVINGADTPYHLLRIEGLKEGLMAGQFPVRIHPGWLQGHGYATGIFYCDTFLYLPALFRVFGFPMGFCYLGYKLFINGVTVWIAYTCFKEIFRDTHAALFGTALYTLSIYRFVCMYLKDHLGQYTAMTFLPLVALGFWLVLKEKTDRQSLSKGCICLTTGMTALIQCHVLTCEMVAFFGLIVCLICYKKWRELKVLLQVLKAVCLTILFNLWFLVPFFDYMMTENLRITGADVYTRSIQEYGSLLPQLLGIFHFAGGSDKMADSMNGEIPFTMGFALVAVLLCYGYVMLGEQKQKPFQKMGNILCGVSLLGMWMATIYFPWNKLQSLGGFSAKLISALQYPTRILEIVALLLSMLGSILWITVKERRKQERNLILGTVLACLILPVLMFLSDLNHSASGYFLYDNHGMGNGYLSGKEYLPVDTDEQLLKAGNLRAFGEVEIENYEKKALQVTMDIKNSQDAQGVVEVPILHYKGYTARDMETGQYFTVSPGENHVVRIQLPPNYEGRLCVAFQSPWYWTVAGLVSWIGICVTLGTMIVDRMKRKNDRIYEG